MHVHLHVFIRISKKHKEWHFGLILFICLFDVQKLKQESNFNVDEKTHT
jgi:hypothetical protein